MHKDIRADITRINRIGSETDRFNAISDLVSLNNPYDFYKCKTKSDFSKRHLILRDILEGVDDKNAVMGQIRQHTGYPADDLNDMKSKLEDVADKTRPRFMDQCARALYGIARFIPFTGGLQKKIMQYGDVAWIKHGYGRIDQDCADAIPPMAKHRDHSSDRDSRLERVRQQYQNGLMEGMDLTSSGSIYQGHHRYMVAQEIGIKSWGTDMAKVPAPQIPAPRSHRSGMC